MNRSVRLTVLVAGLMLAGAGTSIAQTTSSPDASAVRREVESLNRGMEAAVARGDLKGVAAFYAENAVVRSAHRVDAQGRAAVERYFLGIGNAKSWKLDAYGVTAAAGSNLVYETGRSTLVHGAPERTSVVQFLVVWERQRDGALKIVLDYYHVPEPAAR
jgi:ketosteroid isomerase-like protein